jgi:hypothetical protein
MFNLEVIMKSGFGVLLMVIGLNACTNQQVYNSVQTNQKNECEKLQTIQREECMKRLSLSYDKYEAERQTLLKKKD